jgi:hypothetical protein
MNALDRSVLVDNWAEESDPYPRRVNVRPSDVLTALDGPAVQEMVERGVWALAEVENSIPGTRHYRTVRAVIEAVLRPSSDQEDEA